MTGLLLWMGLACHHAPPPSLAAEGVLREVVARSETNDLVYLGTVRPRGESGPPLFQYERRVTEQGDHMRSFHVTFAPDGAPVLSHEAEHSSTYELLRFEEIHGQTGGVGQVEVARDGTATYTTMVDGRTRTRIERPGDPLQAGPTLFGYLLEHREALEGGAVQHIRFVVVSRRRSYRFALRRIDGPLGTTTFEMVPTDPIVALGVPRGLIVFDEDGDVVRYEGLVPPLQDVGGHLKRLDATVTYDQVSDTYR
ncbi:MAG: hypothetical protein KC621_15660 [Myxococcales bacterium]|nr:hypothetical protein [Myxococcales bacterium]